MLDENNDKQDFGSISFYSQSISLCHIMHVFVHFKILVWKCHWSTKFHGKFSNGRRNVECGQQTGVVNQKQLPSGGEPRLASRLVRALAVTVNSPNSQQGLWSAFETEKGKNTHFVIIILTQELL